MLVLTGGFFLENYGSITSYIVYITFMHYLGIKYTVKPVKSEL